ncbi:MAG: grpE family protein [Candidatus Xenolissoclinum pacificiensis L6]|uniref:Protein GrpE n=1 Tax=Candidatus Xenolissoclinum pacificiensis L6 TaxID=1401685 RepID=W2V0H9_9RICK|nr:MAG: grpE family protein [Candidatus Xenolissoclinum pacificiensis L6]
MTSAKDSKKVNFTDRISKKSATRTTNDDAESQTKSTKTKKNQEKDEDPVIAELKHTLVNKEEECAELSSQISDLKGKLQYCKQQYTTLTRNMETIQNTHKQDMIEAKEYAFSSIVKNLLDSVEVLEKILQNNSNSNYEDLKKVVEITYNNILRVFTQYNIEQIIPKKGDMFNPDLQMAVSVSQDKESDDGTIFNVERKGYKIGSKVLKPALVIVVKNDIEEETKNDK